MPDKLNSQTKNVVVLLATFNGRPFIDLQLKSCVNQIGVLCSIFISDDLSTDNTKSFCQQYAEQDSRIILLPNSDKFGSAAPNFFRLIRDVDFSGFNYIAFADQDDVWNSDKLSRAIEMLKQQQCDGYSSNFTAFWPDGREKFIDKAQPQVEWDYLFQSPGPGCTFVITKKLALELQTYIRSNQELMKSVWLHDWFIYAFARSHDYKWIIDKKSSMFYRQHENNQVGVNTGYKAFLHRIRFVLSGKALEQSSLLATLCGLEDNPFIKNWHDLSRKSILYLALNATKCRRKRSEQLIFALSCCILFFIGHKRK